MITISVLGLDQFVVGHYSKDHTENLANLFETNADDIEFYAPNSMLFHNGVEQTSWNTIIIVKAPHRYELMESKIANYLIETMKEFSINLEIEFEYFEEGKHYQHINTSYPRFIAEENLVDVEGTSGDEDDKDGDEADPRDRADLDFNDPNQLYLGDAFKDKQEALDEKEQETNSGLQPGEGKKK